MISGIPYLSEPGAWNHQSVSRVTGTGEQQFISNKRCNFIHVHVLCTSLRRLSYSSIFELYDAIDDEISNIGYRESYNVALLFAKDIISFQFWRYDTWFVWETSHYCACWPDFPPGLHRTFLTRRGRPDLPSTPEKLNVISFTMRQYPTRCVSILHDA